VIILNVVEEDSFFEVEREVKLNIRFLEVKLNIRFLLKDYYGEEDSFSEVLLCSPPRVP